ncbi:hypothetical protein D3C78_1934120 [compost metagenome]
MLGTGQVAAGVGDHQFQAPTMNAALLIELGHPVLKHRAHHVPGLGQWPAGGQQGT